MGFKEEGQDQWVWQPRVNCKRSLCVYRVPGTSIAAAIEIHNQLNTPTAEPSDTVQVPRDLSESDYEWFNAVLLGSELKVTTSEEAWNSLIKHFEEVKG